MGSPGASPSGLCTATPDLLADDVPAGVFRTERCRAFVGIVAPFAPAFIGLVSLVSALAAVVLTPMFYVAITEGLPGRRGASTSTS